MILTSALMCLALNVYHEARGEPLRGQQAVAMVTMNRASWDQQNVCNVVYQRKQFSWTHTLRDKRPKDSQAWAIAQQVSRQALTQAGDTITHGATHYHATYVRPGWSSSLFRVSQIGQHIFYVNKPLRAGTAKFSPRVPAIAGGPRNRTTSWLRSFAGTQSRPSLEATSALWVRLRAGLANRSSIFGVIAQTTRSYLCSRPRRTGSSGQSGISPALTAYAFDRRRPYETGGQSSAS